MKRYPGTVLTAPQTSTEPAFAAFDQVLRMTGGITLSQLCDMTGLEPTTVQNWVKRGWVPKPNGKRYGEQHMARVFLINALKGALQLESIVELLHYMNGNLNDTADDILHDRQLYDLFCRVAAAYEAGQSAEEAIEQATRAYDEVYEGAREKLQQALAVMLPAYRAVLSKRKAELAFSKIKEELYHEKTKHCHG
ncbi:MAG: DUF1836 domain-containing protein [Clostridia bacterium]|nr:DUF1836 domain-containing protein [Clostridia bacterium]